MRAKYIAKIITYATLGTGALALFGFRLSNFIEFCIDTTRYTVVFVNGDFLSVILIALATFGVSLYTCISMYKNAYRLIKKYRKEV